MTIAKSSILVLILTISAHAQSSPEASFETSYRNLQKKIEVLKDKGEKVSDQTRQDLEELMTQMNHQHTQLKRELEKRNQEINLKLEQTKREGEDWTKRVQGAYGEFRTGCEKAWAILKQSEQ